jgi:hypothetical protein
LSVALMSGLAVGMNRQKSPAAAPGSGLGGDSAGNDGGKRRMRHRNERVELEMKILKARLLARQADDTTRERLEGLATELAQKLREIDE